MEQQLERQSVVSPVKKAVPADLRPLSAVLTRAFQSDPVFGWLIGPRGDRSERMESLFSSVLKHVAFRHGQVYSTLDFAGAAVWMPPGARSGGFAQDLVMARPYIRAVGLRRVRETLSGLHLLEDRRPRAAHFYLMFLGVDPTRQGQGVGTRLVRPVLERCDGERIPAYLETGTDSARRLYERLGFQVKGELTLPHGGPRLWLMWREPV